MSDSPNGSENRKRPARRLRPDAAALLARARQERLGELYTKPVEKLDPEEIAQMKAAFFRG